MYIVKLRNGDKNTEIHGIKEKLKSGSVVKGINTIDSFSFAVLPSNAGFNAINDLQTLVEVYNTNKNRYEFHGRILYSSSSMDETGFISKEVLCESFLGFLCDSQQKYVEPRNWTVKGLLSYVVSVHNSQVEEYKHFTIGEVTVTDPNDNLYIGIQRENSWQTIKNKLIDKLGGEITFRVVDGVIYLDYLEKRGATLSTEIALSRNMKAITREDDPTAYISRLIPLGAKLKDSEGNDTEERLDITSVNGGVDYIESEEALQRFGIRYGTVIFEDVTTASNLLSKAKTYLAENNKVQIKYSISALDLSLLGLDINDFDVCNYYPIKNALLGIDDIARIIKKTVDVVNESQSSFEVGDNFKTLSDIQLEREKTMLETAQKIESAKKDLQAYVVNKVANTSGEFQEIVVEQHTTIMNDFEQVIFNALQSYTEKDDLESYKEIVESQLQLLAEQMTLKFTETTKHIEEVNGTLQEQLNTVTKYFTFDIDGLTIGQVDNPNKVVIDNDQISILVNGVVVQSFDAQGQALIPELTISKRLNLFGYVIEEDAQGNVNCAYAGGE
jgi:phage minor structural protein